MPSPPPASDLRIRAPGDDLCLRFANTRFWRGRQRPLENLAGPVDLLRWVEAECGLPAIALRETSEAWRRDDARARACLEEALALREAIFRVFAALPADARPSSSDIACLNHALAAAPARDRLGTSGEDPGWAVASLPAGVAGLLAPVLWSAGDLLLGPRAGRVRQCANPECQWLFLDDSKSGNRRWCSMSACGNRAKAHRHYRKVREARGAVSGPSAA